MRKNAFRRWILRMIRQCEGHGDSRDRSTRHVRLAVSRADRVRYAARAEELCMPYSGAVTMEREIAKCRVALSLIAIVSVGFDPGISPIHVTPLEALRHDWSPFAIVAAHLTYAIGILLCVGSARLSHDWIVRLSMVL